MSCPINEGGVHWCANCDEFIDDGDGEDALAELEALRAQVATLRQECREAVDAGLLNRQERDEARGLANMLATQRDAAQAACVAKDERLAALRRRFSHHDSECSVTFGSQCDCAFAGIISDIDAALATDVGAPVLALFDECAGFLECEPNRMGEDPCSERPGDRPCKSCDLLTRLKARGPSRFVSAEKVREVALKVAEEARERVLTAALELPTSNPAWCVSCLANVTTAGDVNGRGVDLAAIVDALLAEVTT